MEGQALLRKINRKTFTERNNRYRQYHRAIKPLYSTDYFQVHNKNALKRLLFASIFDAFHSQKLSIVTLLNIRYSLQHKLLNNVAAFQA